VPAGAPEPEKIGSIAEGVQAKGLHDVLTSAEELMRGQKFAEALQKYDVAQQVAPNNALITMGRANAELAASYYRRAESSLRDAVGRAPELVVAQFDLRSLIGADRLQVLVRDLKELAANDPKQPRPSLLLAYIAYNTGNEAQAGEYLAAAEQRAGGDDALIKAWRRSWKLPAAGTTEPAPQPDANK
jgi:tetratricopeptide (TPR) repeat protein